MYPHSKLKDVNEVRAVMLKAMVKEKIEGIIIKGKVDLTRMPPCLSSLRPHIQRVNYRAALWKRAHEPFPNIPPATDHGWKKDPDSPLEPL